ncbi:MAG: DUF2911 domain-containing protein, partial [Sinomicrobium sp.]|nr:DUF2911 domain-containing protein [Sinomicrobium sp.]
MRTRTLTLITGCLLFLVSIPASAQLLNLPRGSQMATVSQRVGITDITITYSRPGVKGREIWGKLVPYGMNNLGFGTATAAPWRAGANENTTIEFTDDVKVEGRDVKAGIYGLHMEIREDGTAAVILSRNSSSWGSFFYDESEDALRVNVTTKEAPHHELLTFEFNTVDATSAVASLIWGKKEIPFKIEVPVTAIVIRDIKERLRTTPGFSRQTWEQAANFALNNGGDLNDALQWINNAIEGQFYSEKTANNLAIKATILDKMGQKEEGYKLIDEAAAIANTNQLNALGYRMLNAKEYDRALKFFKMNVKNNPDNANVYDSLGEAYKTMGDKRNAIKSLKKALSLNPPANVRANSVKLLKE